MARRSACSMTVLAALALGACGGGSASKTPPASLGQVVSAKQGAFSTVIPKGYENAIGLTAKAATTLQYIALGPSVGGLATNLLVRREAAGAGDIEAASGSAISKIKESSAHQFSSVQKLSVDGEPARAVSYLSTGRHSRAVLVVHGPWLYTILDGALPSDYAASLVALEDVLRAWRWQ